MSSNDNMIHARPSEPGSVRSTQLGASSTAGGPASALTSYGSVRKAQRLSHDSIQPPDAPKNYRELSPDSLFPHEGARAGSLQNPLYDVGSPASEPAVRQHQYVEVGIPEAKGSGVTQEETRINPPRVEHTESNEQAIKAQERHIQSILRHYCGDSEDTQLRVLELILKHNGKICRIERRKRAGAPSGGVQSLVCLLCPPTSGDQTVHFEKANAVRTFAEHLTHEHLQIPNPFICFAAACGKVFPYSQDRDRHEKQIHKMYRPKAYQALLKNRVREQSGKPPVRPAQVNPHQTATPGTHQSIQPSSKRRSARRRSPKVANGLMSRSKTPVPNYRVVPYTHGNARSRSSNPHPSREGDRNVSHSNPFNTGIHYAMRETDDRGRPIMTGPESHMFPASSPQSRARLDGMQASVDGVMERYHATGGTQAQMSHGHYSAPTTMPQPGSNMVSNPPTIGSMMASSIGYQHPSTSAHAFTPSAQFGNHATMGLLYEQPREGPTSYGSMYNGMQNRMPPLSRRIRYQHDNYGLYGSTQPQPSHHGYVRPTMYQAQPRQLLQDGPLLYGNSQNASTSSSPWPRPQSSTTVMSYTTPHPARIPGHGPPSYTTYPPSGGSHDTNLNELNIPFYYDLPRPFIANRGSDYTTHGGAGASQYNQSYTSTNNSSQQ